MRAGKFVFAQLMEFLPWKRFQRLVLKYGGERYVKHFSCSNQFLSMAFAQLTRGDRKEALPPACSTDCMTSTDSERHAFRTRAKRSSTYACAPCPVALDYSNQLTLFDS